MSVQVKFDESVFPLANFSQTVDSHEFATSTLKEVPAYFKTGASLPPPSHPTNGSDSTPGFDSTPASNTTPLPSSLTTSSGDLSSAHDNMDVERTSSDVPPRSVH